MGMSLYAVVLLVAVVATVGVDALTCANDLQRCGWEPWGEWSACSKTCGRGTRARSRGLCCKADETYEECKNDCGLGQESSWDIVECSFVCPAGNCSFGVMNNTGILDTNYFSNTDDIESRPVIHLMGDFSFCQTSCLDANLQNGYHCWGFTYNATDKCRLYFFNQPLTVSPSDVGKMPGTSLYVRRCSSESVCKSTAADVIFLLDSSGSIGADNFKLIKGFVQEIIKGLDIDPNYTRIGLITFSEDGKWRFKLNDHSTKTEVLQAVQKVPYEKGGTNTAEALELLRQAAFTDNRTVPKIAVVITDGLSRYPSLTRVRASILRQQGILMYAIGVGNSTDHNELFDLASTPEQNYMLEFREFEDLSADNVSLNVEYVSCKAKIPTTTGNGTSITGSGSTSGSNSTCKDTIDDCLGYGRDMCTDYGPWAHAHCPLYCNFCEGPKTTPAPCEDAVDNCDSYGGEYICQEKSFIGWVQTNCRKYCKICKSDETTTTSTTAPTTPVPVCRDTIDNCDGYKNSCDNPAYRGYLGARCAATCGYCKSYEITKGQSLAGNVTCPDWNLPTECTLESQDPGCCPLPRCPSMYSYDITVERVLP